MMRAQGLCARCADAAVGGAIVFDNTLSGATIHLASQLTLSKNVTIDGLALATPITISGDTNNDGTGAVRAFTVNSGVVATLKKLTITKERVPCSMRRPMAARSTTRVI